MIIWTVGHSNRTLDDFIALLSAFAIQAIADVRRYPGSRRWPHFAKDALGEALPEHDIAYAWLPALGGRRRPVAGSRNDAWENESFRAYADHLATPEFAAGLAELVAMAGAKRTAVMCSEALWWRCHRRLIADVLVVRGWQVIHILGPGETAAHAVSAPGRIVDGELTYASPQRDLLG